MRAHLRANRRCTGGFVDICRCQHASEAAFSPCSCVTLGCSALSQLKDLHTRCRGVDD